MTSEPLTRTSTLRDLLQHPLGRDLVDKVLLFTGAPRWLPELLGPLRLGVLDRVARPFTGPGLVDELIRLCNQLPDRPSAEGPPEHPWWRGAVFYQIYPRSFADGNGDGIGDIRGIIDHLDHVADLGVDCLWLSPIFDSPNRDMGYDVRDYRAVMREMGTLDDVDELIARCHERGMRIILDLVVNHTSAEHEWFRAALADPDGEDARRYFLVEGDPERPPTNWRSFFSGSAWRWLPEQQRWALHLFDRDQMDLDWDNPVVRRDVADIVRWWMDRGIDGFRLDVINYVSKPSPLRDGHPFVGTLLEFTGIEQYLYGPKLDQHLAELRRDGFTRDDGTTGVMIGETPGIGIQTGRMLSGWARRELDLVFNFDVLDTPGHTRWDDYAYDLNHLARYWCRSNAAIGEGDWVALFLENHDNPRIVSKVCPEAADDPDLRRRVAKLVGAMLLTMRGTPFLYQGQELGRVNEPFTGPTDLRDVESLNRHAQLVARGCSPQDAWAQVLAGSRDHARTPMRWTEDQDDRDAWLPGHERTPGFSVAAQRADEDSVHHWYRRLIRLRREHTALATGRLEVLHHRRDVCCYVRRDEGSAWLVELNLGAHPRRRPRLHVDATPVVGTRGARMAPWSVTISRIDAG